MSYTGRQLIIRKDGVAIAGARAKTARFNNESINVSHEEEDGFRHLLGVIDTRELVLQIEGVLSQPHVSQLIQPKLAGELIDVEVEFPDGYLIQTDGAYIQDLQITGEYKNAVMFSASLVISGAWTLPPDEPTILGSLYSWGSNGLAQSGAGTVTGFTAVPTLRVTNLLEEFSDWRFVDSNSSVTLAIRDGQLYSCGSHLSGMTGVNLTSGFHTRLTRIAPEIDDWVWCSTGYYCCFAIRSDGSLYAWGDNRSYITAQGTTVGITRVPTRVGSETGWSRAINNNESAIAIKDGELYGWGRNYQNANALNVDVNVVTATQNPTAAFVTGAQEIMGIGIAAGAVLINGEIFTFGSNQSGATCQGTTSDITAPLAAAQAPLNVRFLGGKTRYAQVPIIGPTGAILGWGVSSLGNLALPNGTYSDTQLVDDSREWRRVEAGNIFMVALGADGRLYTAGYRNSGRTGDNVNDNTVKSTLGAITEFDDWLYCRAGNGTGWAIRAA